MPLISTITLPLDIRNNIIAHARAGKPEEICGLVRGKSGIATGMYRARNIAPNPICDYEVAPTDLLVQFDWQEQGEDMIAIYHSHPADPAYPSASDAYDAHYPDAVYLICSLLDDDHPVIRGFYLRPVAGEIDLHSVREELDFYETRPGRWAYKLDRDDPIPSSLASLDRPAGLTLYVVFQENGGEQPYVRAVSVEPVDVWVA